MITLYHNNDSIVNAQDPSNNHPLWQAIFGEGEGYLCLASGERNGGTKLHGFTEKYLRYPEQTGEAVEWVTEQSAAGHETYFCTHLLEDTKRRRNNAAPVRALWADGDDAEVPEGLPEPSVTVESSTGRTQLYWSLSHPVDPDIAEKLNKRIILATGADSSGYDLTQLLRPVGTVNHKYPGNPTVTLTEATGELHDPDEFDRLLPELPAPPEKEPYTGPEGAGFSLEDWLERNQQAREEIIEEREDDSARIKYAVVCPWVEEHTGEDDSGTYLGQYPNGALFFSCHHDHCADRRWRDYREYHEPEGGSTPGRVEILEDGNIIVTGKAPEDGGRDAARDTSGFSDDTSEQGGVTQESPSESGGETARDTVTPVTGALAPSAASVEGYPFPLHALPPSVRYFVSEAAHAKETPVEFVALPLLVALGSAIGASRRIRLTRTWGEYPTLYAGTVALPASGKSPAEDAAMGPVERQKKAFNQEHKLALEEYKQEYKQWEAEANEARKKKQRIPPEPEKPVKKRIRIGDATLEAVQQRMVENPRGLVLARDELAGFFNTLNQYRAGADREFWLSQHSGRVPPLDRKSNDESYDMDYPCVSVLGSIQPDKMEVLDIGAGDGMVERFLFAWPEAEMQPDSDRDIPVEVEEEYHRVWDALRSLEMGEDEYGNPAPKDVPLASGAEAVWEAYKRAIKYSAYEPGTSSFMQGVIGKMKAHLPRLALILALTRTVSSGETREEIRKEDLDNAWELAKYFVAQSYRVYSEFVGVNKDTLLARALGQFLKNEGGEWTGPAKELYEALKALGYAAALPKSEDAITPAVRKVCSNSPALSAVQNKRTREGRSLTLRRTDLQGVQNAS